MDNLSIKPIIKQICAEKGLSEESVMETINSAIAAAYRKDFADKTQNIAAEFNLDTGKITIYDVKEVVEDLTPEELEAIETMKAERERIREAIASGEITAEELRKQRDEEQQKRESEFGSHNSEQTENDEERHFNPRTQIQLVDAKKVKKSFTIGDFVKTELEIPGEFGRMAAQTAKQVIVQRLREAERNVVYQVFKDKEGQILGGAVQKFEGRNIIIDIERTPTILPQNEQIRTERYKVGDRLKVFVLSVSLNTRGPEIIVSRTHPDIVRELFHIEIPEIANGTIKIKSIAREAGGRTKIAVASEDQNLDPIGSCIGQRGSRIQTIIHELGGEKIDVIEYNDNAVKFITNAILPAKIKHVELNETDKTATLTVAPDQLSLAIGRGGQNVRLASKLTSWHLTIKEEGREEPVAIEAPTEEAVVEAEPIKTEEVVEEKPAKKTRKKKKEADVIEE
ncbi:MAG: transcription termination factor NusA [Parcubacteria group bacterium]